MNTEASLTERWIWLTVSLGIAILAIAGRWALERSSHRSSSQAPPQRTVLDLPWVVHPLRLLYAVGIPAAALLWRRILTERGLGLQPLLWLYDDASPIAQANWQDWVKDIGWTAVIALSAWIVLAMGDRMIKRRVGAQAPTHHDPGKALREAVYHQVHWAFYREPFVLLWGSAMGAWAGLIPVTLEAMMNPARWEDLQHPSRGRDLLIRIGLALVGTMLYIQTQNLWLTILADATLVWILGQTQTMDHAGFDRSKSHR